MFSTLKRIASTLLIVSMVIPYTGVALAATSGSGYAISVTATSTSTLTFSMSGAVSADPYKGTDAQQIVMVTDWGDGSSATSADTNLTFGAGNSKTFSGTWSAEHTYATPGNYSITVNVCHQSCNGGDEGKDFSAVTINPFVGPSNVTTYTLTYSSGANGSLTGSTTQIVASGSNGSAVTAVPASGFHFVNWSDASTTNPRTDTNVVGDVTVTANFAADVVPVTSYTVTYLAGASGTITGSSTQILASGSNGTAVTASANSGFHFVSWSDTSTQNPRTDTNVTSDHTFTATFAEDSQTPTTYTLTYSSGANGSLTGSTTQIVASGSNGSAVTAVPASGFHFVNWSDASTTNPRTDTNVVGDVTVTANFAIDAETPPVVVQQIGGAGGTNGVPGCKNPLATNYDPTAVYDGPCTFAPTSTGEVLGASTSTLPAVGEVLGASTSTLSCSEYIALNAAASRKALREGGKNDAAIIQLLQRFLNEYVPANLPITGYFGPLTTKAVKQLQLANKDSILTPWGLTKATGIVYVTTLAHINNTKCPTLNIKVNTSDLVPATQ